jgi:hypothetical protein
MVSTTSTYSAAMPTNGSIHVLTEVPLSLSTATWSYLIVS